MSDVWTPELKEDGSLPASSLSIDTVYYEYDEPLIFSGNFGPMNCLFVKVLQKDGISYLLASETESRVLRAMNEGRLSVYGALSSDRFWLISNRLGEEIYKFWGLSENDVPARFFPKHGKGLHHWFGTVPDTLAQADGILSLKYKGASLEDDGMPLGKLKALIEQSSKSIRKMLSPLTLQGSKTSTFDVKVAPLEFASLLISVREPTINASYVKKSLPDTNVKELQDEFYERANFIANGLDDLSKVRGTSSFNEEYARKNFSFLSSLLDLLPDEDDFLKSTEISARSGSKVVGVVFDKEQAKTIRSAIYTATHLNVTETGMVGGYIEKAQTVRLQSSRGKEVTCKFKIGMFDEITKDTRFIKGRKIKISGKLTVRPRVDLLHANGYEFI